MTENKDPQDKNQPPVIRVASASGIIYYPRFVKNTQGEWELADKSFRKLLDLQDSKQQSETQPTDEVQQNKEELSMIKENKMESIISTDPPEQSPTSEQETEPEGPKNGVFIRRPKGMSFDEFKKFCIKKFREAGLIKD